MHEFTVSLSVPVARNGAQGSGKMSLSFPVVGQPFYFTPDLSTFIGFLFYRSSSSSWDILSFSLLRDSSPDCDIFIVYVFVR
jgi:uncharacterized membrane protein YoaT (DUF817 family)